MEICLCVSLLILISISGMLSRMRGLELNFGDFELNFGDFDKKREIFRGDRGMPRLTCSNFTSRFYMRTPREHS